MIVEALLRDSGLPRSEALLLLAHASGRSRESLIAGATDATPVEVAARFSALARRRSTGEPIAYLVGYREFYGRRFGVDANVLIPRPETELLVEQALDWIDRRSTGSGTGPLRALDLGTGSGAIAITVALERPSVEFFATDRSDAALDRARRNAAALRANVYFAAGDWFDAVKGFERDRRPSGEQDSQAQPNGSHVHEPPELRFDLIVSNPPYVALHDRHLAEGDLRFEPMSALTDFDDGLAAIRRIAANAMTHLLPVGALMIEHGYDQAPQVGELLAAAGFSAISSVRDLAGIERVTLALTAPSPFRIDRGGPDSDGL